jgi:hypothetical protein
MGVLIRFEGGNQGDEIDSYNFINLIIVAIFG